MSDILKQGYAGILIRVFDSDNQEVIEGVTQLTYVHSEKADDASTLVIKSNSASLADHPALQEDKQLNIVFGYTSGKKQKRKVWIFDVLPEYTHEGVTLRINAYCKAAYLKLNTSSRVWNNTTLEKQGQQLADSYGLKFENQVNSAFEDYRTDSNVLDFENKQVLIARETVANPTTYVWQVKNVPQAGASDDKVLQKTAETEPLDNLVIEGRDDKLIIRKRRLNQAPYKTLVWRGEPGNLLKFFPQTNNKLNQKYGISNKVTGWNEEEKEFVEGDITKEQTGTTSLGDNVRVSLKSLKEREQEISDEENAIKGAQPTTVEGTFKLKYEGVDENGNPIYRRDFTTNIGPEDKSYTMIVKRGGRKAIADLGLAAIESTAVETRGIVVNSPGEVITTVEESPEKIAGVGIKRQSEKEMEMVTATATVVGDPELESGKVITIKGVGRKFSGNWYVSVARHEILENNGYVTVLELLRNALNKVKGDSPAKVTPSFVGVDYNNGIANDDGTQQLREIPVTDD